MFKHIDKIRSHRHLISIALCLFFANQLLELASLSILGRDYSTLCRWDCLWYLGIVENGYDLYPHLAPEFPKGDVANWAFFPILPIISFVLKVLLGLSSQTALILTGKVFFALSIFAFIKFGLAYYPKINPWILGLIVSLNPYSIYANVGYTESAFLFFTCTFFYLFKSKYYLAAGFIGGALSAVRFAGIFIFVAILPNAIASYQQMSVKTKLNIVLAISLIPLGLSLWMLYLYHLSGDALAFMHIQKAWGRQIQMPWIVIYEGLITGHPRYFWWVSLSLISFVASAYFFLEKKYELAILLFISTVIPLATGLYSMQRYIFWQAPFLLFLALIISKKPALLFIILPVWLICSIYFYYVWPISNLLV